MNLDRRHGEETISVRVGELQTYHSLFKIDVMDADERSYYDWIVPAQFNASNPISDVQYLEGLDLRMLCKT